MTPEIKKYILYALLAFIALILWNNWSREHTFSSTVNTLKTAHLSSHTNKTKKVASNDLSGFNQGDYAPKPYTKNMALPAVSKTSMTIPKTANDRVITVTTDEFSVRINPHTGNIEKLGLVQYPLSLELPHVPFSLLNSHGKHFYLSQSGLIHAKGGVVQVKYSLSPRHYQMEPGQKQLDVVLKGKTASGLSITKTFHFVRNSYVIGVSYHIFNISRKTWEGSFYAQIIRSPAKSKGFLSGRSYHGASVSTQTKPYEELKYSWLNDNQLNRNTQGGWIAIQQQYFLTAWIGHPKQDNHYYSRTVFKTDNDSRAANVYVVGYVAPPVSIRPGKSADLSGRYYAGPEIGKRLKTIAPGLSLTVDYGWLWMLSEAIFWVMDYIHQVVSNWGWSVILITLLIKLIFYKFSESSYRSMARMHELAPRIKILKERYSDDKQRLSKETIALYKKEKVNPAGGCLPMVIQIPFFIALYYVLIESVQLRQASFLWVADLSAKDPFYILPILVGITMFIQQKITPAPPDPTQAKAMMALPVVFTVMFLNFPAGLTLYWFTNNVLTIVQQWYVMRRVGNADQRKKQRK